MDIHAGVQIDTSRVAAAAHRSRPCCRLHRNSLALAAPPLTLWVCLPEGERDYRQMSWSATSKQTAAAAAAAATELARSHLRPMLSSSLYILPMPSLNSAPPGVAYSSLSPLRRFLSASSTSPLPSQQPPAPSSSASFHSGAPRKAQVAPDGTGALASGGMPLSRTANAQLEPSSCDETRASASRKPSTPKRPVGQICNSNLRLAFI